ncbi:hypothetical protein AXI59_01400 [Bacillus nakamurai]|uniref:hypothetical protein n=1 Tax=Bacillus nakamurai TaxID=1793963 RepID=UPI0007781B61|nr:hypothetical protein [Bacillus nakamurai]KXZ16576.1 hypothetical protein AXI59_01400 [Bacillus nakamurai]
MKHEELEMQLMLMRNAIVSLHDHLAPDFRTRDLALLKHGFTEQEISDLDGFFAEIMIKKLKPSKDDFRKKLAEIKGIPSLTDQVLEDILLGYKADDLHTKIIEKVLK